jgi:hypothetical protein
MKKEGTIQRYKMDEKKFRPGGMDVCLLWVFVLSGRGLCDGPIPRPEGRKCKDYETKLYLNTSFPYDEYLPSDRLQCAAFIVLLVLKLISYIYMLRKSNFLYQVRCQRGFI